MFARIPSARAADAIPRLMAMGAVDRSVRITKDGEYRYVPLLEGFEERVEEYVLVRLDPYARGRERPQDGILRELSGLPAGVRSRLPMRWEHVGDIVILKTDIPDTYWEDMGSAYAHVLGAKTVCVDRGVEGEFRRPRMDVIFGSDTVSTKLENGIRYRFDVTKVMYSSGNTDERERMRHLDCSGETVVDMFAGIGYFTLPLARFSRPGRVIACEKNPDSYGFLTENVRINGVSDIVETFQGDNRDLPGEAFADRIIMGYVQRTREFLGKAVELLRDGGVIHYHDTFPVDGYDKGVRDAFSSVCDDFEVLGIREVKSFAPSVSHYVADVRVRRTPRNPRR